jgi:hypothetical protein
MAVMLLGLGFISVLERDRPECECAALTKRARRTMMCLQRTTGCGTRASEDRFRVQIGAERIVYRVFELAGVLSFLECAPSREEALGKD